MLENKIRPATLTKRDRLLTEGVILLYDNTHSHTAQLTKEKLQKLRTLLNQLAPVPVNVDLEMEGSLL
ncbi:hypothetical protein J6590_000144 [Homalodisca vitripennis]|nr:hypothetical protein J6590_000144 [Homalodisca vitripennis]